MREPSIPVARVLISHEANPAEMRERNKERKRGKRVSNREGVVVKKKEKEKKRVIERSVDERGR